MKYTLMRVLGFSLATSLWAALPVIDTKPYFDLRARLSTQHCSSDTYRAIYTEKGHKVSDRMVLDMHCPNKISITLNDSSQFMFVTNNSEAWVLHKTKNGEITTDTIVEYYPDASTHWPSLWMTFFQKLAPSKRSTTEEENAKEFLEAYLLMTKVEAKQLSISLKSKANHLPNVDLLYKDKEPVPHSIEFTMLKHSKRVLERKSLAKLDNLDARHFIPDIRKASKVYQH